MVVTLMQIQNKGKLSFCASKRPIIFFSFRLMRNGSNDEKKTVFLTFGGPVFCMFLSVLFVSEPSSYVLLWQNFWLQITVLFFSPRGCQRSFIVLVVKFELSPNPHDEHTGHKIKRDPERNKSSRKHLKIIGSVPCTSGCFVFFGRVCFFSLWPVFLLIYNVTLKICG